MTTNDTPASRLRRAAESKLTQSPAAASGDRSMEALLHELQVHQIELEMQNEALRNAQEALEASRDRYVDLYEFAPIAYLSLSDAGQIAGVNLTGAVLLGQERGQLLGRRFSRFIVEPDRDLWERCRRRMVRPGGKQSCEVDLFRGDGTVCSVHLEGGRAGAELRIVLSDVSELRAAMLALRRSESRLQLAKAAAGLGMHDRDVSSGRIEWDARVRELWGVGPEEPVSFATFMAGVHPADRKAVQDVIDQAFDPAGNGEYAMEYRVVNRRDRSERHVAANGKVHFEDGRAARVLGMLRDITAEKALSRDLQTQRKELEALASRQVALHTAVEIAHELNQPLASGCLYSEAALGMLRGQHDPAKLLQALKGALAQARRAGQCVLELIAFLQRESVSLEAVDLNALVIEALAIAATNVVGDFKPMVDLQAGLRPVCSHHLQLLKVVVNLLHNGIEAMAAAGVQEGRLTVRTFSEGGQARLSVEDSGPGIDADMVRRIYQPFFSTKPGGLGLGLSISRALVEAQAGQLWADAGAGPGATLHLSLPFAAMSARA